MTKNHTDSGYGKKIIFARASGVLGKLRIMKLRTRQVYYDQLVLIQSTSEAVKSNAYLCNKIVRNLAHSKKRKDSKALSKVPSALLGLVPHLKPTSLVQLFKLNGLLRRSLPSACELDSLVPSPGPIVVAASRSLGILRARARMTRRWFRGRLWRSFEQRVERSQCPRSTSRCAFCAPLKVQLSSIHCYLWHMSASDSFVQQRFWPTAKETKFHHDSTSGVRYCVDLIKFDRDETR